MNGELHEQWHVMNRIFEKTTNRTWSLSGEGDDGEPFREFPIHSFPFRVGRRTDVSLAIPSPTVSNLHAEIVERDGLLILHDMGSTNGTFLNGKRIAVDAPLNEGDLVQFASVVFRLARQDESDNPETLQGENCDRAMALIQFDRLMSERAVVPFFQPIVRSEDEQIIGYEVLGRSHLFGLKNSCVMFEAASQLNLETELSRVCRWIGVEAGTHFDTPGRLFVNTHPNETNDMDVLQLSMSELREEFPDPPLTLEIHESTVTSAKVMRELKAALDDLEIELAYDDFGSGQARLVELVEVPPHVLKFDLALIRDIDRAPAQRQRMLASLVRMVQELGVQPLAEGMETEGEAKTCVELGFQLNQGFYYGVPAPVEDLR